MIVIIRQAAVKRTISEKDIKFVKNDYEKYRIKYAVYTLCDSK